MKTFFLIFFLLPTLILAQVTDDFEDGDFTQNPGWSGTETNFIVNTSSQLQLNDTAANISYLVTANSLATDCEWRCWVKLSFSPSANNNARIYLVSDQSDLTQALNGYFLQLGESGSSDAIELFRQEGETVSSICGGTEGLIATSFSIRIKVTRSLEGLWKVFADPTGGENFQAQGEGFDNTFTSTSYFGFYCLYTVSNSTKMYFDDVYLGPVIVDNEPPVLLSVSATSDSTLKLIFNEPVEKESAETVSNYGVDQGIGIPLTAIQNETNGAEIQLMFDNHFENGKQYTLDVSGVKDLSDNEMLPQQFGFSYYQAQPFDIVVNEIMADPSPQVGLPNFEYLELFNQTDKTIDLDQWILTIGSSNKTFSNVSIDASGYLILSDEEAEAELSVYGPFYGFSSFTLTNSGQTLTLIDKNGNKVSGITYSDNWYKDPDKEDGGWSLEQINPQNICSAGDNWRASENASGGTPGEVNSVFSDQVLLPGVDHLEVVANNILRLFFNQAMEPLSLQDVNNYSVDQEIGNPSVVFLIEGETNVAELYFDQAFSQGIIFNLTVSKALTNCLGVHPENDTIIPFGLGEKAAEHDVIVNEILFNPWTNGVDYVEVFNRSEKVIDLSQLQIGTVKVSPPNPPDTLFYSITNQQTLFVPGTYICLTISPEIVKSQYHTDNPNGFIKVDPFPAYNNGDGSCLLFTYSGEMIDAFDYSEEMHYPLLNYVDGVSLERISFDNPTQDKNNWHSAAESSGFGTPAFRNSQFVPPGDQADQIIIEPEIFSPDNDGYNDVISIKYLFAQPGYMMTVHVFNSGGHLIRKLVNNQYLGVEGAVNWDGIQDDNSKAPIGIYIFYIQVYDLNGNVKKYKKTGVLASKL